MSDPPGPILCIDVQYVDDGVSTTGYAAGVLFETFTSSGPSAVFHTGFPDIAPYEAGAFFKRELPPVLGIVDACPVQPSIIIVDGFVDLAPGKPGLGRHLYEHLGGVPVIGVAKNPFRGGRRERTEDGESEGVDGASPSPPHDTSPSPDPTNGASDLRDLPPGAILRGTSSRPLYVTAAGIDRDAAARLIRSMHGENRIPTMLKLVDATARRAAKEAPVP